MAYQNNNYQQNYQQGNQQNYQQGNQQNYQQGNQQGNQQNYHQGGINVSHVMKWCDGSVSFALTINGVTIYGMRVVSFIDQRDGQNKRFIAFPKRKGSDGKYYHIAYYKLSDSEENEILRQVDMVNATR